MPNKQKIQLEFTYQFERDMRRLMKKYRQVRSDVETVTKKLEAGETPGDQVPRTGYTVFKVRIKNSDLKKGKRAGYRLLYYLEVAEKIILLTIYSKTEQGDVSAKRLQQIIEQHTA